MPSIQPMPLPPNALLADYAARGAFTDCYAAQVARTVSLAEYVEIFYTGRLFKAERWLLGVFLSAHSTDAEARELALGRRDAFAAWRVEARTSDQVLMCDLAGRTRSWLMVSAANGRSGTQLVFGSAVVPRVDPATGRASMGLAFRLLLGFHAAYSRALLGSARTRLARATV